RRDARAAPLHFQVLADEGEVRLEQPQGGVAERPVFAQAALERAHGSFPGLPSMAAISRPHRPAAARPAMTAPTSSNATTSALAPHAVRIGVRAMISPTVRPISARKASSTAMANRMTAD